VPFKPQAAFLALAAAAGCASHDEVFLEVTGDAPGAVALFVRLVDDQGVQSEVHSAGNAESPVKLPASVYLQLSRTPWAGAVIWVADAAGTVVAQGMTPACVELAAGGRHEVQLAPAPDGWSPAVAAGCRCDPAAPMGPMCRAPAGDGGVATDGAAALDASLDGPAPGPDAFSLPDAGAAPDGELAVDAAAESSDGPEAPADARAPDTAPMPDAGRDAAATSQVTVPNALFGFELAAPDWLSTDTTLVRDTRQFTEGAASLSFTVGAGGTASVKSRLFATSGLGAKGGRLSVDLFVGAKQIGDSNMEMWVDCQSANVYGVYLGYKALTALKAGAWTSLSYTMPAAVAHAFTGDYRDCEISFQVAGQGLFRYDRLGFAP
jgi:hypothetical protein